MAIESKSTIGAMRRKAGSTSPASSLVPEKRKPASGMTMSSEPAKAMPEATSRRPIVAATTRARSRSPRLSFRYQRKKACGSASPPIMSRSERVGFTMPSTP